MAAPAVSMAGTGLRLLCMSRATRDPNSQRERRTTQLTSYVAKPLRGQFHLWHFCICHLMRVGCSHDPLRRSLISFWK